MLLLRSLICLVIFQGLACALLAQAPAERKYTREEDLVYARPGGEELRLDAFLPKTPGVHPAVLVIHGGAWRFGDKGQLRTFAAKLASEGYAAFAISYRLAPKHKHPAQIEDCRQAARWIVDNAKKYQVDTERLGAYGYSAGGHLAALLAVEGVPLPEGAGKQPTAPAAKPKVHRLKAVVAGGAPCDLGVMPPNAKTLDYWLGGSRASKPELYKAASPIAHIGKEASPIFFFHGEDDTLVNLRFLGPRRMVDRLKEAGVETDLYVVPGAGHVMALLNPLAFQKSVDFLDKHLKR
jgi:acetyl esterase/lipase